jgi:hypothetical protein
MPKGIYLHKKYQGFFGRKHSEETKQKIRDSEKGKIVSDDTKTRISLKMKGRKQSKETIEKRRLKLLGHITLEKTRRKIGSANKIALSGKPRYSRRGVNSNFWKGGVTLLNELIRKSLEYKIWRRNVFERDDFTCQNCGKIGGTLQADHIKPFSKIVEENQIKTVEEALNCPSLWDINNGRTLCLGCHKQTETYGGRSLLC